MRNLVKRLASSSPKSTCKGSSSIDGSVVASSDEFVATSRIQPKSVEEAKYRDGYRRNSLDLGLGLLHFPVGGVVNLGAKGRRISESGGRGKFSSRRTR